MISSLLNGGDFNSFIVGILYRIPAVFIAICFHEYAHALAAHWLGDDTAKMYGRMTPNPAAHFDFWGALFMLLFGFGWAKPVPFNGRNLKKPKRDSALIAIAGPLMNLIIAFVSIVIYSLLFVVFAKIATFENIRLLNIVLEVVLNIFSLNIGLMVFNLIPIPPLDGSKVLFSLLPAKCYNFILTYERYGMTILMVLILLGVLDVPLGYLAGLASIPFQNLFEFILKIFM